MHRLLARHLAGPALGAFVVAWMGCRLPGPRVDLRPAGVDWWCTRNRSSEFSLCERVASDCESIAASVRADAQAEGSVVDVPPCHAQPRAYCHTFRALQPASDNFRCYETDKDCDSAQRWRRVDGDEFEDVSRCDEWE